MTCAPKATRDGDPVSLGDRDVLVAFRRTTGQMRSSTLFQEWEQDATGGARAIGRAVAQTLEGTLSEPLSALLISVRRVLMRKEPSNFLRVSDVLIRRDGHNRTAVVALCQEFLAWQNGQLRLGGQEVSIKTADLLDVWLNGVVFHGDSKKTDRFERLLGGGFSGPIMVGALVGSAIAVAKMSLALDDLVAKSGLL
jgi:hypothetical protein